MVFNSTKNFCFRIIHRDNLVHVLQHGLVTKHHPLADPVFVSIGNPEIIDVRDTTAVKFAGYGNIGDYVPFYFTPRSIMLYNIITGYYAPKVLQRSKAEIVVIRCKIDVLAKLPQWFFTNGQANDDETDHFNDIAMLDQIDWTSIQGSNFMNSIEDYDRSRRYQAEFLVRDIVPVEFIESIIVYNEDMLANVLQLVAIAGLKIPVHIHKPYLFD